MPATGKDDAPLLAKPKQEYISRKREEFAVAVPPLMSDYTKLEDLGNMPGANAKAYLMLPVRVAVFLFFFCLMYPLCCIAGFLRALYLRVAVGKPSEILKYGTYPYPNTEGPGRSTHAAATHYPAQLLYDQPLDEAKLRAALLSVTAEDGIKADEVALTFMEEKPNDWPATGSYDVTSALLPSFQKGYSYINKLFAPPFGEAAGYPEKIKVRARRSAGVHPVSCAALRRPAPPLPCLPASPVRAPHAEACAPRRGARSSWCTTTTRASRPSSTSEAPPRAGTALPTSTS